MLAIIALGVMFFKVVAPFLLPLFLAAVAAVLCQPAYHNALKRTKGRHGWAAGIVTTLVMAGILLPLTVAVVVAAAQAYSFSQQVTVDSIRETRDKALDYTAAKLVAWQDYLPTGVKPPDPLRSEAALLRYAYETGLLVEPAVDDEADDVPKPADDLAYVLRLPFAEDTLFDAADADAVADLTDEERATFAALRERHFLAVAAANEPEVRLAFYRDELTDFVNDARRNLDRTMVNVAGKTVGGTLGLVGQGVGVALGALVTLAIFLFALYYFLKDGPKLIEAAENLIPVHAEYQRQLLTQFATVVRAVVLATFLAAFVQGALATLALGVLGFDHLLLLLVASVVASLIPVAGTTLVWLPCALILLGQERYIAAGLLTAWGAGVVGTVDNVVRTYVLNNDTKLHPLLALISVLGGLQVMGFWGVFVGPIVASCLHALVKIFNHELTELSKEAYGEEAVRAVLPAAESEAPEAKMQSAGEDATPDEAAAKIPAAAKPVEAEPQTKSPAKTDPEPAAAT